MAFQPVTPVAFSANWFNGVKQQFTSPVVKDLTGTAVDLSTWNNISCNLEPTTAGPIEGSSAVGIATGNADGTISLILDNSFTPAAPGQCRMLIFGNKASGDANQLLASGTLTVI